MNDKQSLLEICGEGGSINLYADTDINNITWYYFTSNETDFLEEELEEISYSTTSKKTTDLQEILVLLQERYRSIWQLYPIEIKESLIPLVIAAIKKFLETEKLTIQDLRFLEEWARLFKLNPEELAKKLQ